MIEERNAENGLAQLPDVDSGRDHSSSVPSLPWEAPSSGSILRAFMRTCRELLLHPRLFFNRMARSGGLDEPLLLFSVVSGLIILLAFPIALVHFHLTAPGSGTVPISEYNRHLFPSRLTGLLVISLPVLLFLGNLMLIVAGMLFHLAARVFGGGTREESISILIYAKTAGALPLFIAELVMLLAGLACLGASYVPPNLAFSIERMLNISIGVSTAAGMLVSVPVFIIVLVSGTSTIWRIDMSRAAAASLAGMLLVTSVFLGPPVGWLLYGSVGAGIVVLMAGLSVIALFVSGHWLVSCS